MATYVTKKCPHCGFPYQVFQSGKQRKYGCPLKTCARCFEHYWDNDIVEPAFHGYENSYETWGSIKRIITIVFCTPFALMMLGFGIWALSEGEMAGLFPIAFGGIVVWAIGSYIKQKIDDKRHWADIVMDRQLAYDKSIERLKNTNYLTALANFDKKAKNC